MKTKPNPYSVDDYEIRVCYNHEAGEFTAQVVEMPGIILGGPSATAALEEARTALADTIEWYNEDGDIMPPPGSRPARLPSIHKSAAAASLGRIGGSVKSPAKAAASRRNGLLGGAKGARYGHLGGRPKKKAASLLAA